jgi:hypothetical protein
MPYKFSFLFLHYTARIFGSLLYPMFSGYGENEFKPGQAKIIFCRQHGFVTLLNLLRFFISPIAILVNKSESSGLTWKIAEWSGLSIYRIEKSHSEQDIFQLVLDFNDRQELPVFVVSQSLIEMADGLARRLTPDKTLFFAVSGCERSMSLGFIPVVKDMKALCVSMPLYCKSIDRYKGMKELDFLEEALEKTPQFELPTFFHTHSKFS